MANKKAKKKLTTKAKPGKTRMTGGPAKKASARGASGARRAGAGRTPAVAKASAAKSRAGKAPAKKSAGRKSAAVKAPPSKAAAAKMPARKPMAMKSPATKTATMKSGAMKAPAKKTPKKPSIKTATKPAVKTGSSARGAGKSTPSVASVRRKVAKSATRKPVRRFDRPGHLDPHYAAELRRQSAPQESEPHAFLDEPRARDDLAEERGEEVIEKATTGEDEAEEMLDQVVPEEQGGPFVETNAAQEFAHDTDASNPKGAKREPFPTT
jgi:hypothetical protein